MGTQEREVLKLNLKKKYIYIYKKFIMGMSEM